MKHFSVLMWKIVTATLNAQASWSGKSKRYSLLYISLLLLNQKQHLKVNLKVNKKKKKHHSSRSDLAVKYSQLN